MDIHYRVRVTAVILAIRKKHGKNSLVDIFGIVLTTSLLLPIKCTNVVGDMFKKIFVMFSE